MAAPASVATPAAFTPRRILVCRTLQVGFMLCAEFSSGSASIDLWHLHLLVDLCARTKRASEFLLKSGKF